MRVMEDFLARGLIEVTLDDEPVTDAYVACPYLEQALDYQLARWPPPPCSWGEPSCPLANQS